MNIVAVKLKSLWLKPVLMILLSSGFIPLVFADSVKQLTVNDYLENARTKGSKANRLLNESSPYLLQHAYNPVNWYAWGEQAFAKAKKEGKPIFLSIGYSTCHWCHVMARESFENKKIAAFLNRHFVSIKVDREQRPDIDAVYMSATELINGHGGWPMTVFLDSNLRPFHAATYYPPFSADGRLGLQEVLLKIHELWTEKPDVIYDVATSVTVRITQAADDTTEGGKLSSDVNSLAMSQIAGNFDDDMGGFSAAPKFPRPGIFAFLNRLASTVVKTESSDTTSTVDSSVTRKAVAHEAKNMMKLTLDMMAAGGIYDQLAGGFHRYSVDASWQVPHFEKMLYSQALMIMAYNDFYRIEQQDKVAREKYKKVIYQTLDFVKQEMRSPQGGFYSALDADSERVDEKGRKLGEHAEGAYYLWHESELKQLLTKDEFSFIQNYFHIREHGNIFSDPQGEFTDLNIFFVDEEYKGAILSKQQQGMLDSVKKKLNEKRRLRPRPHLDDKVITAWNGMMLSAISQVSLTFGDEALLTDAIQVLHYVKQYLFDRDSKRLFRQYREKIDGTTVGLEERVEAVLADYVWLIDGLLQVYEVSSDKQWLDWAMALQKKQDELFLDTVTGTYFEAASSDVNLLFRSKSVFDGALPSANAVALSNLRAFAVLSQNTPMKKAYTAQADGLVSSFASAINQNPAAAAMLLAVEIND